MDFGERAEGFGDHQRGVVGKHDAAGADPDVPRSVRDMPDQYRGRRTGNARHVVVFRDPVTGETQVFHMPGGIQRDCDRVADAAALAHRDQVEHREWGAFERLHAVPVPGV